MDDIGYSVSFCWNSGLNELVGAAIAFRESETSTGEVVSDPGSGEELTLWVS